MRQLVEDLARADAYPHSADDIELIQTHISVVTLAGPYAYKVRKPVDMGFLDFTTLEKRHQDCLDEVRLNRRLAPEVYLGVVPLADVDGRLVIEGNGPTVEYAVKMMRLPAEATLLEHLRRGELTRDVMAELGRRVAAFHERASSGPEVSRFGRFEIVAENARANLRQARRDLGESVSRPVVDRLEERLERRLQELRGLIDARADADRPCDTHGDLHLDHVYRFPEREPPGDLIAIDCIEFNERFRYADPVADVAFLVMDLRVHGRQELADVLADAYFEASGDTHGRELLDFYVSYRAAVRAKVEGLMAAEEEVEEADRHAALDRARAHWLLALTELEEPDHRPCLVLVGGLPGTGKSTLSDALARSAALRVISSDRTRKRLAGLQPEDRAGAAYGRGLYTEAWTERTYRACLDAATEALLDAGRVLVDASFGSEKQRAAFLLRAEDLGVRAIFLLLEGDPAVIRQRIESREGGASDADWHVHEQAAQAWDEPSSELTRRYLRIVSADGSVDEALRAAEQHLRDRGVL